MGLFCAQNIERPYTNVLLPKFIIVVRDKSIFVWDTLILKAIHRCCAANIARTERRWSPTANDPQTGNDRYLKMDRKWLRTANDPEPQMIPNVDCKWSLDRKWPISPKWTANVPRCGPQMIPNRKWCPDRKWSMSPKWTVNDPERTANDPQTGNDPQNANDPEPQMIPPENEEWHVAWSAGGGFNF